MTILVTPKNQKLTKKEQLLWFTGQKNSLAYLIVFTIFEGVQMKKFIAMMVLAALFVSCGSSDKKEQQPKEDDTLKIQIDYKLQGTSTGKSTPPSWIQSPSKGDKSKNRKKHRYFVNESEHSSKRLAVRSAEARANARIAQEIAQFMKNTFAEATQGGEEEEVTEYMQEQLAQEAQTFIVGASVIKTYWEKRRYLESMGAEEDKTVYHAYALVRMSKKNLEKAVRRSRAKLLGTIEAPEVKKKTDKILKDVDEAFNKLDEPVAVKDIETE